MHHPVEHFPTQEELEKAVQILRGAKRIAVLTGAGVSAESGVPTFRGAGGLWEGHSILEVATPEAFEDNPALVWRFYNARRANLRTVKPNPGHYALAALEERWTSTHFTLCTQNIDGLHRAAGSRQVLELHGRLTRVRCTVCTLIEDRPGETLDELPRCPQCGELLRPDIVWFHEMLPADVWLQAALAAEECDCFLVVGTSAVVYPAASLVDLARTVGARVIEINLDQTEVSHLVTLALHGKSGEILPELVKRLG